MQYEINRRFGINITENMNEKLREILNIIESISDEEIIEYFQNEASNRDKSLSKTINSLLNERIVAANWIEHVNIFEDQNYSTQRWTYDYFKDSIDLEVAFNHEEAVLINLRKGNFNEDTSDIAVENSASGIIMITVTNRLKIAGNFDNAVADSCKYEIYLNADRVLKTVPVIIIGLEAPDTFRVNSETKNIEFLTP